MGRLQQGMLALTVLALTGCASSPATPRAAQPAAAQVTEVLTFQAYDDSGLLPNLVRASVVGGSCPGGSLVHPGRADAWRCRDGEAAFDPCFANSTGEELACAPDPWSHEVTVLRPAAPLGRAGQNRNDPGLPPWFVELTDGTRCGRVAASSTYRCVSGPDAGEPDTSTRTWTVDRGGGVRDQVRTAWY